MEYEFTRQSITIIELENSVASVQTVEAELKDSRHAACEAAVRLQKTDAELRRSLSAEAE